MGFPIRISTDQRVFAPPRSFSQRITSFIACACQGIHQLPLRHLIVLIANAHPVIDGIGTKRPASRDLNGGAVRLTHHVPGIERPMATNRIHQHPANYRSLWNPKGQTPNTEPVQIFSLRCHAEQATSKALAANLCFFMDEWWSQTGSNRRPPACKAGALPAELWPQFFRHVPNPARQGKPLRKSCRDRHQPRWWAWEDLNLRPHAYQARALTN